MEEDQTTIDEDNSVRAKAQHFANLQKQRAQSENKLRSKQPFKQVITPIGSNEYRITSSLQSSSSKKTLTEDLTITNGELDIIREKTELIVSDEQQEDCNNTSLHNILGGENLKEDQQHQQLERPQLEISNPWPLNLNLVTFGAPLRFHFCVILIVVSCIVWFLGCGLLLPLLINIYNGCNIAYKSDFGVDQQPVWNAKMNKAEFVLTEAFISDDEYYPTDPRLSSEMFDGVIGLSQQQVILSYYNQSYDSKRYQMVLENQWILPSDRTIPFTIETCLIELNCPKSIYIRFDNTINDFIGLEAVLHNRVLISLTREYMRLGNVPGTCSHHYIQSPFIFFTHRKNPPSLKYLVPDRYFNMCSFNIFNQLDIEDTSAQFGSGDRSDFAIQLQFPLNSTHNFSEFGLKPLRLPQWALDMIEHEFEYDYIYEPKMNFQSIVPHESTIEIQLSSLIFQNIRFKPIMLHDDYEIDVKKLHFWVSMTENIYDYIPKTNYGYYFATHKAMHLKMTLIQKNNSVEAGYWILNMTYVDELYQHCEEYYKNDRNSKEYDNCLHNIPTMLGTTVIEAYLVVDISYLKWSDVILKPNLDHNLGFLHIPISLTEDTLALLDSKIIDDDNYAHPHFLFSINFNRQLNDIESRTLYWEMQWNLLEMHKLSNDTIHPTFSFEPYNIMNG